MRKIFLMNASSDFTPTTDLINGSPKNMVTYFLLNRCNEFSRAMLDPDKVNVESMTADLLSYCPDISVRTRMWKDFVKRKGEPGGALNAALLTKGDFWAYICSILEFTEEATGGW